MVYFVLVNRAKQGPYSFEQLKALSISPDTMVWREGLPQWVRADSLAELKPLFSSGGYFYNLNGVNYGPVDLNSLIALKLPPSALVWKEGLASWVPISSLPETASFYASAQRGVKPVKKVKKVKKEGFFAFLFKVAFMSLAYFFVLIVIDEIVGDSDRFDIETLLLIGGFAVFVFLGVISSFKKSFASLLFTGLVIFYFDDDLVIRGVGALIFWAMVVFLIILAIPSGLKKSRRRYYDDNYWYDEYGVTPDYGHSDSYDDDDSDDYDDDDDWDDDFDD